jgi:hypothetical protein
MPGRPLVSSSDRANSGVLVLTRTGRSDGKNNCGGRNESLPFRFARLKSGWQRVEGRQLERRR